VLLHNVHSDLPKNIILSKYDITYLKTHEGFTSFRIDELTIIHDNGKKVILMNDKQPEAMRTFQVTEDWLDPIIYKNAIQEKSSFKYQLKVSLFQAMALLILLNMSKSINTSTALE
jgi:hypothetical protein